MRKPCVFSVIALVLFMVLPASAATATISQILSSPSSYDGSHVDVTGKVERLEQKVSHKGNPYVTFSLCSSQCIHVFEFGNPSISDGEAITVHGSFEAVNHVSGYTFYNEIDADEGSL